MVQLNQIYRCNICGNIIEILHAGTGKIICCGKEMELLKEQSKELGYEKHVPVIEKFKDRIKVKIGSIPHPMESNHYIEFIELIADGRIYRKFLNPNQKPEAEFCVNAEKIYARTYCNVHNLWGTK